MSPDQPPAARLHVVVTDQNGRPRHVRGLADWLERVAPARAHGEVTVALVTDATMRRLNRRYGGHDYATDVLSFPDDPADSLWRRPSGGFSSPGVSPARTGPLGTRRGIPRQRDFKRDGPRGQGRRLGDIAIATGVARRQAREARHPLAVELRILALHGLLHLLGYDHETDAGTMARVERRLRARGGLGHGLLERDPSARAFEPARLKAGAIGRRRRA